LGFVQAAPISRHKSLRPRFCLLALVVGLLVAALPAAAAGPHGVLAWGCGNSELGCNVPAPAASGVTAIAAGAYYSLALKKDGAVLAWGCGCCNTDHGQCTVPAAAANGVTAIAAGYWHGLALKQDGSVIAWGCSGSTDYGQCSVPAAAASGVIAIAASFLHSLALKQDGSVIAWGCGDVNYGQCTVPAAGASGVTAIAAGEDYSLAVKQDGSVLAWGCGSDNGINRDFGQCSVPSGLCDVTAIAAGTFHSLALAKACQTITFGALVGKTFGDPDVAVSASASSGLPLSIAVSGSCTISGASVHITGVGSCTVTTSQPGDSNFAAAPDVSHSFAIAKASQSITFGALANTTYGAPDFGVSATASSGLAVSFAASGSCTVSGAMVHLMSAGSCTVTASQAGNANYNAAPDGTRTFAIGKASQTIAFGPLANKPHGAPDFGVGATASSGLAVSFAANWNCTVSSAMVHLTGAGSCTITASQPGDANYNAAPGVPQTFAIAPVPCTVPNVVGRQVAPAKLAIAKRHCRTGKVGYAYSRKRKKDIVISQNRRPGRVLPAGSKIDLIVSRGRKR
jgi:hypothetical protein